MRQKFNYLFIGLLFSGLAFFSYLFLLLYSDFTPQHLEVLISFKSFILILAAFNLVGLGVLMIHNWQKRSFQFLVKRKERLIDYRLHSDGNYSVFNELSGLVNSQSHI